MENNHNNGFSNPDEETLHKTDPQEHMKGPISSIVNKVAHEEDQEDKDQELYKDAKGTEKESIYENALHRFLTHHPDKLNEELKASIVEDPDSYLIFRKDGDDVDVSFKRNQE